MVNERFYESVKKTYEDCLDILQKKNQDYATNENPWKNFEFAAVVGVSPEKAILVRITDKIARISNILEKQSTVVDDEKIEDTIIDACNYLAILLAYTREKGIMGELPF